VEENSVVSAGGTWVRRKNGINDGAGAKSAGGRCRTILTPGFEPSRRSNRRCRVRLTARHKGSSAGRATLRAQREPLGFAALPWTEFLQRRLAIAARATA